MSKRGPRKPGDLPVELQFLIFSGYSQSVLHNLDRESVKQMGILRLVDKEKAELYRLGHCLATLAVMQELRHEWRATITHPLCRLTARMSEEQDQKTWVLFVELLTDTRAKKGYPALKMLADQHREDERRHARVMAQMPPIPPLLQAPLESAMEVFQHAMLGS